MTDRHLHASPTLSIAAVQWPDIHSDPARITLLPGDWLIRMTVRAPVVDSDDRDALRRLLEYALATLDHEQQSLDAHLDDPAA